jgi:integrase
LHKKPIRAYLAAHGIDRGHIVPYSLRHSWLTDWILSGRSASIAAELCGTSTTMIERHYGHLQRDVNRLRQLFLEFHSGQ